MKSVFLALVLITPAFAAWAYRASEKPGPTPDTGSSLITHLSEPIPIEILEKGSAPKVIYLKATPEVLSSTSR